LLFTIMNNFFNLVKSNIQAFTLITNSLTNLLDSLKGLASLPRFYKNMTIDLG